MSEGLGIEREIHELRKLLSSTWSRNSSSDKFRARYRDLNHKITKNYEKLLQVHNRNITLETEIEQFIEELKV